MSAWQLTPGETLFIGRGSELLLAAPMVAFLGSRQCPDASIHAAMDWALQQARGREPVVSGFHSMLQQSVLKVLLQSRCPVVAVLARPVERMLAA